MKATTIFFDTQQTHQEADNQKQHLPRDTRHWIAKIGKIYSDAGKFDKKNKCHNNPTNVSSTTYKIGMTYFKDGIPKEWIQYKNRLTRCLDRQGGKTGPAKFALAGRLLMGRALSDFNNAARCRTTETREHCLQCIHKVTLGVFPQDTLKEKKPGCVVFWRNLKTWASKSMLQWRLTTIFCSSPQVSQQEILRSYRMKNCWSYLHFGPPSSGRTRCTCKTSTWNNTQSRNLPRCVKGSSPHLVTHHQTNIPIRDRLTRTNLAGNKNMVVTTPATRMT